MTKFQLTRPSECLRFEMASRWINIVICVCHALRCVCCHWTLQGSGNLDAIQIIKKLGGALDDSYLDEGDTSVNYLYISSLRMLSDQW